MVEACQHHVEYPPQDLAQQMSLLDWELWRTVSPHEFLNNGGPTRMYRTILANYKSKK